MSLLSFKGAYGFVGMRSFARSATGVGPRFEVYLEGVFVLTIEGDFEDDLLRVWWPGVKLWDWTIGDFVWAF